MSITARYSPSGHLIAQESGFLVFIFTSSRYVCTYFSYYSDRPKYMLQCTQTVCPHLFFFFLFVLMICCAVLYILNHFKDARKTIHNVLFSCLITHRNTGSEFIFHDNIFFFVSYRMQFAHANAIQ